MKQLQARSSISRRSFIGAGLSLCAAGLIGTSGCTKSDSQGDKPLIYTSFFPIQNLVEDIAGDSVEVRQFMAPGKDPHLWEPTPKAMKELAKAELLIVNGANMERWLDQVKDALPHLEVLSLSDSVELITYKGAAAEGDFQYLAKLPEGITELGIEFGHTHEDIMRVCFFNNTENLKDQALINACKRAMEQKGSVVGQRTTTSVADKTVYGIEMGHESGHVDFVLPEAGNWYFVSDRVSEQLLPYDLVDMKNELLKEEVIMNTSSSGLDKITYDPHSWLSLQNAKRYCATIHDELVKRYPDNERSYRKNKLQVVDALTDLGTEYSEKFKNTRIKAFVTAHYAFEYLSQEFGLQQFPLQGLTSMEAPSLKTIRKAVDFCKYHGINTIFYEYGTETKNAQVLASELEGQTAPLASMEYASKDSTDMPDGYLGYMKMNLENLYQSML